MALGAYLGHTRHMSDNMLMKASESLPGLISDEDLAKGAFRLLGGCGISERYAPLCAGLRAVLRGAANWL
jgi:hypothetical protein